MKINKDSLKARANNISKELGISQNIVYNRFFFDAFLKRLATSKYRDKLILKGGLYLSSVCGIESRSTMNIDFYLGRMSLEEERVVAMISDIASIDGCDGVAFEVVGSTPIREADDYGGFQVTMIGRLDNVRFRFGIDIATGDPIIPCEKNYDYECLVTKENLSIKSYSLESVLSEKLQTVLSRGITSSRSKDYYDLYVVYLTQKDKVNNDNLALAFKETCEYRKFSITRSEALAMVEAIGNNSQINKRWASYGKVVGYAKGIPFDEVIKTIVGWVDIVL